MEASTSSIKDILSRTPRALDMFNTDVIEAGKFYLPYSIGIEVESPQKPEFTETAFKDIPNIMAVDCSNHEQRFRIPNGIEGLNCLFDISMLLKELCEFNPDSGIHYHVDFTDTYHLLSFEKIESNKKWILTELDKWGYTGEYNRREFNHGMGHCWLRCQSGFKTIECRIGEMTFDYELLYKRITHLSDIMRRFKDSLILFQEEHIIEYNDDINEVLNTRKIRI